MMMKSHFEILTSALVERNLVAAVIEVWDWSFISDETHNTQMVASGMHLAETSSVLQRKIPPRRWVRSSPEKRESTTLKCVFFLQKSFNNNNNNNNNTIL